MADNDITGVASSAAPSAANKKAEQMKKLKDANTKYKDLLKMAKQRIQSQEEDLDNMKGERGKHLFFSVEWYWHWHTNVNAWHPLCDYKYMYMTTDDN